MSTKWRILWSVLGQFRNVYIFFNVVLHAECDGAHLMWLLYVNNLAMKAAQIVRNGQKMSVARPKVYYMSIDLSRVN